MVNGQDKIIVQINDTETGAKQKAIQKHQKITKTIIQLAQL
jgi:hypothetical protein